MFTISFEEPHRFLEREKFVDWYHLRLGVANLDLHESATEEKASKAYEQFRTDFSKSIAEVKSQSQLVSATFDSGKFCQGFSLYHYLDQYGTVYPNGTVKTKANWNPVEPAEDRSLHHSRYRRQYDSTIEQYIEELFTNKSLKLEFKNSEGVVLSTFSPKSLFERLHQCEEIGELQPIFNKIKEILREKFFGAPITPEIRENYEVKLHYLLAILQEIHNKIGNSDPDTMEKGELADILLGAIEKVDNDFKYRQQFDSINENKTYWFFKTDTTTHSLVQELKFTAIKFQQEAALDKGKEPMEGFSLREGPRRGSGH